MLTVIDGYLRQDALMHLRYARRDVVDLTTKLDGMVGDGWPDWWTKQDLPQVRTILGMDGIAELEHVHAFVFLRAIFGDWTPRIEAKKSLDIAHKRVKSYSWATQESEATDAKR